MKIKSMHFLVAMSFVLSGCQQSESTAADAPAAAPQAVSVVQSGRVAVFDIDYVADQTGMVQEMRAKIEARKEELTKELEAVGKKIQTTLEAEGKKLKKDKDLPEKARALEQGAQIKFSQVQAEADARLNAYRIQLIGEIREAIKPVAREIAYAKGFDILMLRNDMVVFDVKDEAELTQAVLKGYQAKFPNAVKKPEPEPKAEAPKPAEAKKPAPAKKAN
jgi:Skp family chaperone for outer membrane proteins